MPDSLEHIFEGLNTEQKNAVKFGNGPLLIVAGAGTGKTTVVTKRIAYLIMSGQATTDEILALTFTDKAAQEMEERLDILLPYGYVDLWVSTFHAFGERLLKAHALEIGLTDDFKLLDQTAAWLLIRKNLSRFNLDYYKPLGNPTKFISALIRHFSRAKDEEVYPDQYLSHAQSHRLNFDSADQAGQLEIVRVEELANAYHVYQQILLENNALDFGDLINYALKLFKMRPHLLEKYRKQFKYVLVDEFQDTNWAQYELVKMLAAPANNLTVVADDDQSIYKFRGACLSNILTFKNDYPLSTNVVLVNNYRSTQGILDLSHKFIQQNNPNRLEVTIQGLSKKLRAVTEKTGFIEHLHFNTEQDEAAGVVEKINSLKAADPDSSYSDFSILVRANNQAEIFVQELTQAGLPFLFLASRGLYNKPAVINIISYLKLLDNYHESAHLFRVLSLPFLYIPVSEITELTQHAKKKSLSLYQVLQQAALLPVQPETINKIEAVVTQIKKDTQLARTKKVSLLILNFLQNFSYKGLSYLQYLDKLPPHEAKESMDYLNQLYKLVQKFEKESSNSLLPEFLEFISMSIESGDEGGLAPDFESGPDSIKVMTVHASKGLEFKYVFLVNMVDRRFPSTERSEPIELPLELVKEMLPEGDVHLEEERRLFYVGMTRAKFGLYFTSAEDYGGARRKKLSRFLHELGFEEKAIVGALERTPGLKILPSSISSLESTISSQVPLATPTRFSFTQLRAFETCPWQYRYAHIVQIPVIGRGNFSFGKTMHATLQKFFTRVMQSSAASQGSLFTAPSIDTLGGQALSASKIPTLDELLKLYEESWLDDWYSDANEKQEYYENGKRILREFYRKHTTEQKWPTPKYLEKGFSLKIGDYTLKGQIDRIDPLPDGTIEIIDYKTGSVPKDDKIDKEKKEQLWIYQLAAQDILGEKVGKLTYYYLEENKAISFLGEPEELDQLKIDILDVIGRIRKGQFTPDPQPQKCKYCDFKEICEFKSL